MNLGKTNRQYAIGNWQLTKQVVVYTYEYLLKSSSFSRSFCKIQPCLSVACCQFSIGNV